jgi:hypothetical protein
MQNWGKTKVQCLVRNTHSGIYYARARVNSKLLWKTLETDSLTVAKARLPKVLVELGRGSAKSAAMRSAGHPISPLAMLRLFTLPMFKPALT